MATTDSAKARERLNLVLSIGVMGLVFGGGMVGWAWADGGIVLVVGLLLLGVGQLLTLIGCIGHGVQLGSRVARGHGG